MIEARENNQQSFFGNYLYNRLVNSQHILCKINEQVDFSFINDQCKDLYCANNGRPGWLPELMFKILFLQFLYDLSDYAIVEELQDRLSFKMFVGLSIEEAPPEHSSISRFRDRLGAERFKDIFNKIVELSRQQGIVTDKLHIMDASEIRAKVDLYRIKKEHKNDKDKYIDKNSPDKDARIGRKGGGRRFYGYQAHCVMDAESEILLNVDATAGDAREHTQFKPLVKNTPPPKAFTADKAYDCQEIHKHLSKNRIANGIVLKKFHTKEYLKKHVKRINNTIKKYRPHIEHRIAHLKRYHGLAKARYWGLAKVRIQTYMAAICCNVKRFIQIAMNKACIPKICLKAAIS